MLEYNTEYKAVLNLEYEAMLNLEHEVMLSSFYHALEYVWS